MYAYKCSKCGKPVETIPQHCGQSMIFNEENQSFECYMGPECGYQRLDELTCQECCKKKNN
jgi:hypothetical protein